jgi:hypothetical protein
VHLPHDRAPIARHATQNIFCMSAAHERHQVFAFVCDDESRYREGLEKKKRKSGNAWITTRTELLSMANTHALPLSHIVDDEDTSVRTPARGRTMLRALYDTLLETQRRRAQREIDRVLGPGALARAFATELPRER